MYVYICTYIYIFTCIFLYIPTHTHPHKYVCIHINHPHMYIFINEYTHVQDLPKRHTLTGYNKVKLGAKFIFKRMMNNWASFA